MNADGQTRLTFFNSYDLDPTFSPHGSKILFTRFVDPDNQLWVMNANGSGQEQIGALEGHDPAWSPDGSKIAYTGVGPSGMDIFVANADGTGAMALTNSEAFDAHPRWTPDGNAIVFSSNGATLLVPAAGGATEPFTWGQPVFGSADVLAGRNSARRHRQLRPACGLRRWLEQRPARERLLCRSTCLAAPLGEIRSASAEQNHVWRVCHDHRPAVSGGCERKRFRLDLQTPRERGHARGNDFSRRRRESGHQANARGEHDLRGVGGRLHARRLDERHGSRRGSRPRANPSRWCLRNLGSIPALSRWRPRQTNRESPTEPCGQGCSVRGSAANRERPMGARGVDRLETALRLLG